VPPQSAALRCRELDCERRLLAGGRTEHLPAIAALSPTGNFFPEPEEAVGEEKERRERLGDKDPRVLVVEKMVEPGHMKRLKKGGGEDDRAQQQGLLITKRFHQGDDQGGRHQEVSVGFGGRATQSHPDRDKEELRTKNSLHTPVFPESPDAKERDQTAGAKLDQRIGPGWNGQVSDRMNQEP
jgi:hypothetical protein